MHILVTLLLLMSLGVMVMAQSPTPEETKKNVDGCMKETKANRENFVDYASGKLKAAEAPDHMKCFCKCYMEKLEFFAAGKTELNVKGFTEILTRFITAGEVEKAVAACKDTKGVNPCDAGFQMMTCMWHNGVMLGSYMELTGRKTFA